MSSPKTNQRSLVNSAEDPGIGQRAPESDGEQEVATSPARPKRSSLPMYVPFGFKQDTLTAQHKHKRDPHRFDYVLGLISETPANVVILDEHRLQESMALLAPQSGDGSGSSNRFYTKESSNPVLKTWESKPPTTLQAASPALMIRSVPKSTDIQGSSEEEVADRGHSSIIVNVSELGQDETLLRQQTKSHAEQGTLTNDQPGEPPSLKELEDTAKSYLRHQLTLTYGTGV